MIRLRELILFLLNGLDVKPVDKGRYAEEFGDLKKSVDRAALVASGDLKSVAFDLDLIYFSLAFECFICLCALACDRDYDGALDLSFCEDLRLIAKDLFHVACDSGRDLPYA